MRNAKLVLCLISISILTAGGCATSLSMTPLSLGKVLDQPAAEHTTRPESGEANVAGRESRNGVNLAPEEYTSLVMRVLQEVDRDRYGNLQRGADGSTSQQVSFDRSEQATSAAPDVRRSTASNTQVSGQHTYQTGSNEERRQRSWDVSDGQFGSRPQRNLVGRESTGLTHNSPTASNRGTLSHQAPFANRQHSQAPPHNPVVNAAHQEQHQPNSRPGVSTAVKTHFSDATGATRQPGFTDQTVNATVDEAYIPGQWYQELGDLLRAVELELDRGEHDRNAKARLEAARRLLHAIANNEDNAVAPIEELDADQQEFWKHLNHALLVSLDADRKHASSHRAALALRDLRIASQHLANISALDLRNLALCTKVTSYGEFTEFESDLFRPGEEVILYVEVDNFAVHDRNDRFETELRGSYQIIDDSGARVANVVLPVDRQISKNRRRDYFIPYLITLPATIAPGSYHLQLAIEDVIGKKSNHASLDFRIR